MTHQRNDTQESKGSQETFEAMLREKLQQAVRRALMSVLAARFGGLSTFYAFPKDHWKTIRTNNVIERLFGEVKRRSHKMAAFRMEESCLLLFYAVIRSLQFKKLTMPAASTKQPDADLLHNA